MSKRHTDLMISLGMAGGVVDTYLSQCIATTPSINQKLYTVRHNVSSAIALFGRVGGKNLDKIACKIDKAKSDKDILGRSRSIITFIDYAVWMLESSLQGDKPPATIKGHQGKIAVLRVINSLVDLRNEIAGDANYVMSSVAGMKAAEKMIEL